MVIARNGRRRGLPFVLGGALALEAACEGRRRRVRTAAPARPRPRDAAGRRSAADSSPARRVEKYQASEGRGRGEGRKSTDGGAARTKMRPPRRPSSRPGAEPGAPAPAGACLQGARRALRQPRLPRVPRPPAPPLSTPGGTDAIPSEGRLSSPRGSPFPTPGLYGYFQADRVTRPRLQQPSGPRAAPPPPNGRLRPGARKAPLPPPAPPASPAPAPPPPHLGALPASWPTSRQRLPRGCLGHTKIIKITRRKITVTESFLFFFF